MHSRICSSVPADPVAPGDVTLLVLVSFVVYIHMSEAKATNIGFIISVAFWDVVLSVCNSGGDDFSVSVCLCVTAGYTAQYILGLACAGKITAES